MRMMWSPNFAWVSGSRSGSQATVRAERKRKQKGARLGDERSAPGGPTPTARAPSVTFPQENMRRKKPVGEQNTPGPVAIPIRLTRPSSTPSETGHLFEGTPCANRISAKSVMANRGVV